MAYYESVVILKNSLTESQADKKISDLKEILTSNGAEVLKTENWGVQKFTHKIDKHKKGYYFLLNISGPSAAIDEFNRKIKVDENVLRRLVVRVEELEEGPSAFLRNQSEGYGNTNRTDDEDA